MLLLSGNPGISSIELVWVWGPGAARVLCPGGCLSQQVPLCSLGFFPSTWGVDMAFCWRLPQSVCTCCAAQGTAGRKGAVCGCIWTSTKQAARHICHDRVGLLGSHLASWSPSWGSYHTTHSYHLPFAVAFSVERGPWASCGASWVAFPPGLLLSKEQWDTRLPTQIQLQSPESLSVSLKGLDEAQFPSCKSRRNLNERAANTWTPFLQQWGHRAANHGASPTALFPLEVHPQRRRWLWCCFTRPLAWLFLPALWVP